MDCYALNGEDDESLSLTDETQGNLLNYTGFDFDSTWKITDQGARLLNQAVVEGYVSEDDYDSISDETVSESEAVSEGAQSDVPDNEISQEEKEVSNDDTDQQEEKPEASDTIESIQKEDTGNETTPENGSDTADSDDRIITDEEEQTMPVYEAESGVYTYTVSGQEATITAYTGSGGSLSIPESLDDYSVTAIAGSAFSGSSVTSVTLPKTIKSIGYQAFYNCTSLTSVSMTNNESSAYTVSIGYQAFYKCTSLTELSLSENVTALDREIISGTSIASITIPKSVTTCTMYDNNGPLAGAQYLTKVVFEEGTTKIPANICSVGSSYTSNITSVTIPDSVTSIGVKAFYGCAKLTLETLPAALTKIGSNAFEYCTSLVNLEFPNQLKTIEKYAFEGCSSLKVLVFPDSLQTIGPHSFENCTALEAVDFPDSLTTIGSNAFGSCKSLKTLILPKNIQTIDSWAFFDCTSLISVSMTYNDTSAYTVSIGTYAFSNCTSLTELTLSENVTTLERCIIAGTSITSITIPKSVTTCNMYDNNGPLAGAQYLKEVIFEEGTTTIPDYICSVGSSYTSNITTVTLPASVTSIGTKAFYGCAKLTLETLPAALTKIGSNAFEYCTSLVNLSFPNKLKTIGNGAFAYCTSLKTLNFSDSLQTIGTDCFSNCTDLKILILPKSIKDVGSSAFANCTSLTSVSMTSNEASAYSVSIGSTVFNNCTALTELTLSENVTSLGRHIIEGTSIASITIPQSVTTCANYESNGPLAGAQYLKEVVFEEGAAAIPANICTVSSSTTSYITKVVIPESVTSIGSNAFTNCKNITIYGYQGSYAETYAAENNIPFKSVAVSKAATVDDVLEELNITSLINDISLSGEKIEGPSITAGGKTFSLFSVDAGMNLKISDKLQTRVNPDTKTIQVLIGFADISGDADLSADANSNAYWTESYAQVKSLYKKFAGENASTDKLYDDFRSVKKKLRANNMKLGIKASASFAGYIEFSYASGEIVYNEGGVVLEAAFSTRLDYPLPPAPAVYVTFGLGADFNGSLKLVKQDDFTYSPSMEASFSLDASIGAGVGNYKASSYAELGLKGTLDLDLTVPESSLSNALTAKLTAFVYFDSKVFGWQCASYGPEEFTSLQLYPKTSSAKVMQLFGGADLFEYDLSEATASSRSYLDDSVSSVQNLGSTASESENVLYARENIYTYNAPQIADFDDGTKLLVWIDDDGTKSDINKTSVMYMTYDGTSWSDPAVLAETGGANDYPLVYSTGQKAYIVWQKAKELGSTANLTDLLESVDLYMATFEDGIMGTAEAVTSDNSSYEMMQSVAVNGEDLAVAWVENQSNDPFQTSSDQVIKCAVLTDGTWTEQTIASGVASVSSLSVYYEGGTQIILYETSDDTIHILQNGADQIISGRSPQLVSGMIYYTSDSGLYSCSLSGKGSTLLIADLKEEVKILENGSYRAAVGTVSNGFKSELVAYLYDQTTGSWSGAVILTDEDKYIRSFDASLDADGQVSAAVNLVEVAEEIEDTVYGEASLMVYGFQNVSDVTLNAGISYDADLVKAGGQLPVSFDVTNSGMTTVDSLNVLIKDSSGNIVQESAAECSIESGKTEEVTVVFSVPEELTRQTFTVTVSVEGEIDETDNSQEFEIGFADLTIEDLYLYQIDKSTYIKGTIRNLGYDTAKSTVVTVYNQNTEGDIIGKVSLQSIAALEEEEFTVSLLTDYLDISPIASGNVLYVSVNSAAEESRYDNNTAEYLIRSSTDQPLVLNRSQLTMKTGETADIFVSYSALVNASESSAVWSSSNEKVAIVENGTVTAVAAGRAIITAAIGSYKVSCTVTVSDDTAVESVSLSAGSISVAEGSTKQLTASVLPETAANSKVTWSSADTGIATVTSAGIVKGVSAGTTVVTVTTEDGGKTAQCTVRVTRTIQSSYTASFRGGDNSRGTRPKSISAAPGSMITLPANSFTKEGYEFAGWSDGTDVYEEGESYRMPYSDVTFTAQWTEETVIINPFTDVKESNYFYDAVLWAVENGITGGLTATTFGPNQECTRAQVVMFLWRAAGKPEPESKTNPFTDVKSSSSFYKAIMWAVETGITSGSTKTTFSPNATCTRQQIAMFLWRYAGKPAHSVTANPFTDVKSSSTYYNAIMWAVEKGITSGKTATTFVPTQECTRAQIVTFLYRMENLS